MKDSIQKACLGMQVTTTSRLTNGTEVALTYIGGMTLIHSTTKDGIKLMAGATVATLPLTGHLK